MSLPSLRVYYDVEEDPELQIGIVAIGMKRCNRASIGRELYNIGVHLAALPLIPKCIWQAMRVTQAHQTS